MKTLKYLMVIAVILTSAKADAQSSTSTINSILNNYLAVKKALVNSNVQSANSNAASLVKNVADIVSIKLNTNEKKAWTACGEKLRTNAQHISESKSIDHQREHFAALSDAMYSLLKTFKTHPTVYRQYCPMKKEYWLSDSKKIENPYYGNQMLDCGKVTETLTANASAEMLN
ncbi:MAG: DUF3347 domain-containing protein [Sphingobacteriaceae bacterium]|nr:MAG: DUF3347 domain-containing protein [Sphingobacteriaceae bacterium]